MRLYVSTHAPKYVIIYAGIRFFVGTRQTCGGPVVVRFIGCMRTCHYDMGVAIFDYYTLGILGNMAAPRQSGTVVLRS